jgi:hypothetical protein
VIVSRESFAQELCETVSGDWRWEGQQAAQEEVGYGLVQKRTRLPVKNRRGNA